MDWDDYERDGHLQDLAEYRRRCQLERMEAIVWPAMAMAAATPLLWAAVFAVVQVMPHAVGPVVLAASVASAGSAVLWLVVGALNPY